MKIEGMRFSKVVAENTKTAPFTAVDINLNINAMKKPTKANSPLLLEFSHTIAYKPGIGTLTFEGTVLVGGTKKEMDDAVSTWKKKKVIPELLSKIVANTISYACQVNGVLVAKAIGIPAPVMPPKINFAKKG